MEKNLITIPQSACGNDHNAAADAVSHFLTRGKKLDSKKLRRGEEILMNLSCFLFSAGCQFTYK